jgi:GxxExxY protein
VDWKQEDYKHQEHTRRIIGVFYDVYNELGYGFLESVYQRAMLIALTRQGIAVAQQQSLPVWFRGEQIGDFHPDLLVAGRVIVELKACRTLEPIHDAQVLNYLRASDIEVGLLLNFGPKPAIKRLVFANIHKCRPACTAGLTFVTVSRHRQDL